jgi:hypothetical protein
MAKSAVPRSTGWSFKRRSRSEQPHWPLPDLPLTGGMASTTQAQARGFGHGLGIAAGLLGAAVVGSAIAANDGYYHDSYRRYGGVRQYDAYGNFIGRVRG